MAKKDDVDTFLRNASDLIQSTLAIVHKPEASNRELKDAIQILSASCSHMLSAIAHLNEQKQDK